MGVSSFHSSSVRAAFCVPELPRGLRPIGWILWSVIVFRIAAVKGRCAGHRELVSIASWETGDRGLHLLFLLSVPFFLFLSSIEGSKDFWFRYFPNTWGMIVGECQAGVFVEPDAPLPQAWVLGSQSRERKWVRVKRPFTVRPKTAASPESANPCEERILADGLSECQGRKRNWSQII